MNNAVPSPQPPTESRGSDFLIFWGGQTISNFGNAITLLVIPLLIFKLTGSALNLAISSAAEFLPYLLFGLWIGAAVDRLDRRTVMIVADLGRALMLGTIPFLADAGLLHVWWVYVVGFMNSTLAIAFNTSEFASIPHLVDRSDLVTANGRIQASYSVATVAGPLIAGVFVGFVAPETVLFLDSATFLISIVSLLLIRRSLNAAEHEQQELTRLRQDVVEGLGYVWRNPVLRAISIMMALINFVGASTGAQIVYFAKERFHASDGRVSLLYSVGGIGVVLLSLSAGSLRKRWSFSRVALTALFINGILTAGFALMPNYWAALTIWGLLSGCGILFNINTGSLRQMIVPDHLLGRVSSVASVLAWSGIPLGSFLGGLAIEWTGSVEIVYISIGILVALIAATFSFTALGHADQFLDVPQPAVEREAEPAAIH
ncbi:MAG TPA: MFS transporter [Nitrolancea sp.]|nr:MFS transporter [Nitrolancea sp.]